jgi:phage-related protein
MRDGEKRISAHFFAQKGTGNEPVRDWLLDLPKADRRKIGVDIKTVEYGWPLGMPTCRHLRNGVWEVRTDLDRNRISRVLFCMSDERMILLHGFIKKTKATPREDLDLAIERMKEVKK